ncbi:MAG: hypothetical protein HOH19_03075, partial [Kordiimonadaceae bacterium]|nr:hypothetical protein [Kordiimonadaceae bacterium]
MTTFGYNGKILFIDLETCKTRIEEKDDNFWRIYIGGGLLATQLLLEHTPPGIDAFDAENLLIFASSVVAGHPYPSLQRFTISCKSPLTGGIGETRCEGPFAKFLKSSGYEAIVIHGAATTPKNIIIEDGIVHFEKAIDIWGMPTSEADETLQERHGDNIGTAVIGPAGENCVRYATITTNRHHLAFRMGGGAVMGSKNIKAIVLKGGELPAVSAPEKCIALIKSYKDRIAGNELTNWQEVAPGFAAWVHLLGEEASLCTRNFKDSVFEKAANYDQDVFMERFDGVAPCEGCPSDCIKTFSGGAEVDNPAPRGIHQEITCSLGPNIGTESMKDVLDLNILCLEYGLDPVSLGFSLSMIME